MHEFLQATGGLGWLAATALANVRPKHIRSISKLVPSGLKVQEKRGEESRAWVRDSLAAPQIEHNTYPVKDTHDIAYPVTRCRNIVVWLHVDSSFCVTFNLAFLCLISLL